jgi:hypothetical protein
MMRGSLDVNANCYTASFKSVVELHPSYTLSDCTIGKSSPA